MATGRRPFEALTQASLIAKTLETEPAPVSSLVPHASPALDHLVEVCLAKASADRWQTAQDIKLHLEWIRAHVQERGPGPAPRKCSWAWGVGLFAGGALVASSLFMLYRPSRAVQHPIRIDLSMAAYPHISSAGFGAISPDGQRFVFEAFQGNASVLALKHLASPTIDVLAGTEGGAMPFWAPTGNRSPSSIRTTILNRLC